MPTLFRQKATYWVGYCARLRCGRFSVPYASVLETTGRRHALVGADPFLPDAGEVLLRVPALDIHASWRRSSPGLHKVVYQSHDGSVDWQCLVPRGAASVGRFEGLGYVDRLRLTIPPWRLPIRRLRWGRFLSPGHSLIWIDWQGDFSSRTVFLDGGEASALEIDDDSLSLADGTRATFDRGLVIRRGALGSTVLGAIPGLQRIAPARIFQVEECKWRSRSSLEIPGEAVDHGWSIHEVVNWP